VIELKSSRESQKDFDDEFTGRQASTENPSDAVLQPREQLCRATLVYAERPLRRALGDRFADLEFPE
jgi:hypothetical protein